ncbi:hypothetical protein LB456_04610 [Psychroflexus sp. CAK57W]|uniref:PEP/pyruvate-binding domain-containing protein n=1 Tax=Psychroflexus curvus TaxID=2873595 RepID=UPI001CCE2BF3|nr:PEP/pyruvate-binding domain-containing protein [Psychroflexus curvus]MBZ9786732.1 hypothetical protein [Psychroflexus curvus]
MKKTLKGTKAETLLELKSLGMPVPDVYFFSVEKWLNSKENVISEIETFFHNCNSLAIRSSAKAEDTADSSMAGAFHSVLDIKINKQQILKGINEVINSFDNNLDNQVLIQPMVTNVQMSGVVMTKSLNDGSPYYVINYDDVTGKTDSVTSGNSINKTVYIYNGVKDEDFDSLNLLALLNLVRNLENIYTNTPLDIEFAIDNDGMVHLLQVRRITTENKWNEKINSLVSQRIYFLREYIDMLMHPRLSLNGKKTLLGIMPDWNPAEMIGVVPHPLAMSLYRELITKNVWREAREEMGYKALPNVELMVSLYGRAYIDVRNSMNSFLPSGLDENISEKLINAYIDNLERDPHLHDKIEFEVVFTCYDFEFEETLKNRYPGLLSDKELNEFKELMRCITREALVNKPGSSLNISLSNIEKLKEKQYNFNGNEYQNPFILSDRINILISECKEFGTKPFSIIARHGFIAEVLLRTALSKGVFTEKRLSELRKSISTVAGEMSEKFNQVCANELDKDSFLKEYGHLRPSTYDILSPRYQDRDNLFDGELQKKQTKESKFTITEEEKKALDDLLVKHKLKIDSSDFLIYVKKAVVGREYAKFVFTKHVSEIIELISKWGQMQGFNREDMSMLSVQDITDYLFSPITEHKKKYYKKKIKIAREAFNVASSFKLNYLIRSSRDVNIVPMQRNQANFIGNDIIEREIIFLNPYSNDIPDLSGKIVCIEGADPGYDWIFSKGISGLITKYGGANSHMAIRCAEMDIPAAIGCGEQPFERILNAGSCLLDCQRMNLEPSSLKIN